MQANVIKLPFNKQQHCQSTMHTALVGHWTAYRDMHRSDVESNNQLKEDDVKQAANCVAVV